MRTAIICSGLKGYIPARAIYGPSRDVPGAMEWCVCPHRLGARASRPRIVRDHHTSAGSVLLRSRYRLFCASLLTLRHSTVLLQQALGSRLLATGSRLSALAYRLSPIAYRLSALTYRLSAIGYRLSAIAYRLSAIAYQLSAIGYRLCGSRSVTAPFCSSGSGR
jgi:hypothetical protein